jgi:rubrerythrin
MVDNTRQGGAIILEDEDSDKSQNADGSITGSKNVEDSSSQDESENKSADYGEDVIYCEECGYSKDRSESNWFPGDSCPKCHEGYLSAD